MVTDLYSGETVPGRDDIKACKPLTLGFCHEHPSYVMGILYITESWLVESSETTFEKSLPSSVKILFMKMQSSQGSSFSNILDVNN